MNTRETGSLSRTLDDYALEAVPESERKSWLKLSWNTVGICSTLVTMLIGALATFTVGFGLGVLAGVIAAVIGTVIGYLLGNISLREGLSSTVLTRLYGFGRDGSIVASCVFCFMILGMLALENALLFKGVIFYFHLHPSVTDIVAIYGAFTVAWILLALFGMKLVYRVSSLTVVAFFAVLIYIVVQSLGSTQFTVSEVFSFGPQFGKPATLAGFLTAINFVIGAAGALALVAADHCRYARGKKDVFLVNLFGMLTIDVVMVIAGGVIGYLGIGPVSHYYVSSRGMTQQAAEQAALTDMATFFVVLAGVVGFILVFLAQGKAQVLNTYSGSLALSNIFSVLRLKVNRAVFVVLANIISLLMIYGGILGLVRGWLDALGVLTTAVAIISISDYYLIKKRSRASVEALPGSRPELVNLAGVVTLVVASVVALYLESVGIFPVPFVISTLLSVILYPLLRLFVFKPRTAS